MNPRKAEGIAVPVKRCCDCGLVYCDPLPIPQDLSDHYGLPSEDYWSREAHSWRPEYFSREIDEAKRLLSYSPGMRALDIGVGLGKAVRSLNVAGFDTWGCEPSEQFRSKAIGLMGLDPDRIQLAPVEDAEYPSGFFDFITFGAVLEHLYDPHAALSKAMEWLKPGGVIQLEVPSSDWLIARLVNFYFRIRGTNLVTHLSPMHSPFHLYEFTLQSFRDFKVISHAIEPCDPLHIPRPLKPLASWLMRKTGTGMQLTVYLTRA